jgi:hypothetical protein
VTGSFTVQGAVVQVPPGAIPTVRIPVVNAASAVQGTRDVSCAAADATGRSACNTAVTEAGIFPQVGSTVTVFVNRGPLLAAPGPLLVPPPPPPPLLPPPPLPQLAAPPPPQPATGAPIVPEAGSLGLLMSSLAALGALVGWRARRDDER